MYVTVMHGGTSATLKERLTISIVRRTLKGTSVVCGLKFSAMGLEAALTDPGEQRLDYLPKTFANPIRSACTSSEGIWNL